MAIFLSVVCTAVGNMLKVTPEHDLISGHCPLLLTGNTVLLIVYIIFFLSLKCVVVGLAEY